MQVEESTKPVWGPDLIDQASRFIFDAFHITDDTQINEFMVKRALPNFRRFLADSDKIAALSSNLAYYVVNPATKGRAGSVNLLSSWHVRLTIIYRQTIDLDETTLDIIKELSRIPAAARAWRPTVADAFNDARFFNCSPEAAQKWRPLVRALVDTDKTVFSELLGRLSCVN